MQAAQRATSRRAHAARSPPEWVEKVDLRASTLVQLARALGLELVLTPRRVLPMVQSLTESPPPQEPGRRSIRGTPTRTLRRIQQHVTALERDYSSSKDLAEVKSATQALRFSLAGVQLKLSAISAAKETVQRFREIWPQERSNLPLAHDVIQAVERQLRVVPLATL